MKTLIINGSPIPGIIGWILPYFLYQYVKKKKNAELTPLINNKHDEIYELCEKGNKLRY